MAAIHFLCQRLRKADEHQTELFEAEQASKRELQESLEYQTATSEVLNVTVAVCCCSDSQRRAAVAAIEFRTG